MQKITLNDLITKTKEVLIRKHYCQSTLSQYNYRWRMLQNYFVLHKTKHFSSDLATQFIMEAQLKCKTKKISLMIYKRTQRSVIMLIQCYETGDTQWERIPLWGKFKFKTPLYNHILDSYIDYLKNNGYGTSTIRLRKTVSKNFLSFLEKEGIEHLFNVELETIRCFILFASQSYKPTSMGTFCTALRPFLKFLSLKSMTSIDLTRVIPSHFTRKTTIIPIITHQEEDQMLTAINRETSAGKRNYAILLLALRLGIRSIDIANLKLEHLKWQKNTIEFIQQKTGRNLIVPLLADVGNALMNYILHGRQDVPLPYVFLHVNAPYNKLANHTSVYNVVSTCMKKANIRQSQGEQKGAHCLRHTIASRLLAAETPISIISSVLGHSDKNTAMVYLSTDLEHLRACSLGLVGIKVTKEALLR